MKKLYTLLSAAALTILVAKAQNVGIGTATPNLRMDIEGGYGARESSAAPGAGGISIPANVSTFRILDGGAGSGPISVTAPGENGQRLALFNQHATRPASFAGTTIPPGGTGYFIYVGGAWRYFGGNPSSTAWNIIGNAGTTPAANFIGTTDDQGLSVRTFGAERMRIHRIGTTTTAMVWVNAPSPFPLDDVFSANANNVDGLSGVSGYNMVTTGSAITAGVFGMVNRAAFAAAVQGENPATDGTGVRGFAGTGGTGVEGYSPGTAAFGVWGLADVGASAATGGSGVVGTAGSAVFYATGSGGSFCTDKAVSQSTGVLGMYAGNTPLCFGVYGYNSRAVGNQNIGVLGSYNTASFGVGVHGIAFGGAFIPATNIDYAVVGSGGNYAGFFTTNTTTNAAVLGAIGAASFVAGSGGSFSSNVANSCGVFGVSTGTGLSAGVRGQGPTSGAGVVGHNGTAIVFGGSGGSFNSSNANSAGVYASASGLNSDGVLAVATGTGTGANASF
ncbi:MAG: hypothetical protein RMM53_10045, partial [Bacteroidia bacterium]|nr:hypothetical protein [Bacteroidia bacterium]MDW8334544.1 hypothetical protein [Bacteroidia bacterium]